MIPSVIVARARACVGAKFRPQGRNPAYGLDCVGLVRWALGPIGQAALVPCDYALSGSGLAERAEAGLARAGGVRVRLGEPGNIALFEPARGQGHMAVVSDLGVIQAHLGVRKVVEGPADPAWVTRSMWRFGREG